MSCPIPYTQLREAKPPLPVNPLDGQTKDKGARDPKHIHGKAWTVKLRFLAVGITLQLL